VASGHGFKHGPVMGEMVADAVLGAKIPPTEMGASARDHSRLSGVQYGRILVAATVETDFSGLCPDHEQHGSNQRTRRLFPL